MNKASKPLGRWHRWWLKQFQRAWLERGPKRSGGICVAGWEGTVQGRALTGLMSRGFVAYRMGFEGGLDLLAITEEGLKHV